jgi:hypothetical protein
LKNTKHTRKQLILLPPSGFHTFNLFIWLFVKIIFLFISLVYSIS